MTEEVYKDGFLTAEACRLQLYFHNEIKELLFLDKENCMIRGMAE